MSDPSQLDCWCHWAGEPGATWRRKTLMKVRVRIHRWRHERQRRAAST